MLLSRTGLILLFGNISLCFAISFILKKRRQEDEKEEQLALAQTIQNSTDEQFNQVLFFPSHLEDPGSDISKLLEIISSAKHSLLICVMTIIYRPLLNAIIDKKKEGIEVKVYTSRSTDKGSGGRRFRKFGIPVRSQDTIYSTAMHNKFVIIDDTVVFTGSLNWSFEGVCRNQENVLVITDRRIVSKFQVQFEELWGKFDPLVPTSGKSKGRTFIQFPRKSL